MTSSALSVTVGNGAPASHFVFRADRDSERARTLCNMMKRKYVSLYVRVYVTCTHILTNIRTYFTYASFFRTSFRNLIDEHLFRPRKIIVKRPWIDRSISNFSSAILWNKKKKQRRFRCLNRTEKKRKQKNTLLQLLDYSFTVSFESTRLRKQTFICFVCFVFLLLLSHTLLHVST